MSDPVYLVTDDAAILSGDPKRMHPTDLSIALGRVPISMKAFNEMIEARKDEAPDKNCVTTPDGGCVGENCMHDDPLPPDLVRLPPGGLQMMVNMASDKSEDFLFVAHAIMSTAMANAIRAWRVEFKHSWRNVASMAHEAAELTREQRQIWWPAANQIMGMALCEVAAKTFGEDYMREPWN